MYTRVVRIFVFAAVASSVCLGCGKPGDEDPCEQLNLEELPSVAPLSPEQCEKLIADLVYPDKPPFEPQELTPPEIDRYLDRQAIAAINANQKKTRSAYDMLSARIESSLPYLAKHAKDKQLSCILENQDNGTLEKMSVGRMCTTLIGEHVQVYRRYVTKYDEEGRERCSLWFISNQGGVEKWWIAREKKTLAQLQLEGIEWAIRQDKPKEFTEQDWAKAGQALEQMARKIRTSGRPIKVNHGVEFQIL